MEKKATFQVYNASAGSGKTFSLVKSYLATLLSKPLPDYYKTLLAITFTNKAVGEMKNRIMDQLVEFAEGHVEDDPMWKAVLKETDLSSEELTNRSKKALQHILNNYSLFSVETIDHFNHRLIRTFAKDLHLSSQFEVSLDTPALLSEAVDQLIEKAGVDPQITDWLLQFAIQKTEDDKSWDIAIDLNKAAQMLMEENNTFHLEKLRGISLSKFKTLQEELLASKKELEEKFKNQGGGVLSLLEQHGLGEQHLIHYIYGFFKKVSEGDFSIKFDAKWQQTMGEKAIYPTSKIKGEEAQIVESLTPAIAELYSEILGLYFQHSLLQNILKNLAPLAMVHLIDEEVQHIKLEQNILPISDFNKLIYKELKDQPAPFIYERLGERYRHFYIDEFQDTSLLQWGNLMPLIDNSLSQTDPNSLMIVGDAKQAIYRWRGGLPEQFMALFQGHNPFPSVDKEVIPLDTNFRSCKKIVEFNNSFFSFVAKYFGDPVHKTLYEKGNQQKSKRECQGYVSLQFLSSKGKEERFEDYPQKTLETVISLLERGFAKKDICILTRKKEEGVAVSELLTKQGYYVVSEETLLLNNSFKVKGLVGLLTLHLFPENELIKFEVLEFLHELLEVPQAKHHFISENIKKPLFQLTKTIEKYGREIDFSSLQHFSLYEIFERLVYGLGLNKEEDAYLTHFMDCVFQFSKGIQHTPFDFLDYWERQKEKASLSFGGNLDAISVMTVHKSKGLEFPVVIFPFADLDLYKENDAKTWYPWGKNGFEELLINYNKDLAGYGDIGLELYEQQRNTLELDNINILYVALTRAQQELYVLTRKDKEKEMPRAYHDLFQLYVKEDPSYSENKDLYEWGLKSSPNQEELLEEASYHVAYVSSLLGENAIQFAHHWEEFIGASAKESIDFGNYFHDVMEKIHLDSQMDLVLDDFTEANSLVDTTVFHDLKSAIRNTVEHPRLRSLFNGDDTVYCEREIMTPKGVLRPDRINIHTDKSITIVDYKTGEEKSKDIGQIQLYADNLKSMGYVIREKLLVYVNQASIVVKNA